jgi:hypothetical protein
MKNYSLCVFGILVYVIVTIVDFFFVSLPLAMYVSGLFIGSLHILLFFLGRRGKQKNNTMKRRTHMVFHLSKHPTMGQFAK